MPSRESNTPTKTNATMSFCEAMAAMTAAKAAPEEEEEDSEMSRSFRTGLNVAQQTQQAKQRGPPKVCSSPLPPSFLNKMGFIKLHQSVAAQEQKKDDGTMYHGKQTMRPHVTHGLAPPILTLKPITLREIATKVNYIHNDRILWAKTIYTSHKWWEQTSW